MKMVFKTFVLLECISLFRVGEISICLEKNILSLTLVREVSFRVLQKICYFILFNKEHSQNVNRYLEK
uniref:Uncharacterized protein n=1 Tax=Macaca nemestrina TaxID=9545 RepID=A0A2K6B771_MACNE